MQTGRPPVPFIYRTNDILRLSDPGIAEIRKSADFPDFVPKAQFEFKIVIIVEFHKIPYFLHLVRFRRLRRWLKVAKGG